MSTLRPEGLDVLPDCLGPEGQPEMLTGRYEWEEEGGWAWWQWLLAGLLPAAWVTLGWLIWRAAGPAVCLLWKDGVAWCLG